MVAELGIPDEVVSTKALELYEAMLTKPEADKQDLSNALGLSPLEVEALSGELVSVGLVVGDGPWRPVDPATPLLNLITEAEAAMTVVRDRRDALSSLERHLSRTYGFHVERQAEDRAIEIIHGVRAANERLHSLGRTGFDYCLAMLPGPALHSDPDDFERQIEAELDQLSRGMQHRNIVDWAYLDGPRQGERVERLSEAGATYRVSSEPLPIRCLILEGAVVLPMTAEDDGSAGVMIVHASSMMRVAEALFELLWARSTPYPSRVGVPPADHSVLLEDEWILLNYLATGMPDDAIAQRLDVSSRTVRRRIGELADKLGATSRFQLAVRAAAHGWRNGIE